MPVPLSDTLRRIRSYLDDQSATAITRFYSDAELTDWVNDATRNMARRAEDLLTFDTGITVYPGIAKYPLPSDLIRVHRCEFVPNTSQPGSPQTYPLEARTYQELDQVWGVYQLNPSSYPSYFCMWGYPGGVGRNQLMIQFYPVPVAVGTINLFYYRMPYRFDVNNIIANPVTSVEFTKPVEIVEGWDDAVVKYVVAQGKVKDKDPSWKDEIGQFEEMMEYLLNVTRQWHDQQRTIMTASRVASMSWLYGFDE